VGERSAPNLTRYLPYVAVVTAVVIVLPIVVVSALSGAGLVGSVFVSAPLAMLISLAASSAGSAWWKKRPSSHDLVFSDLMIWGWLRRLRTERRLSRAVELLGKDGELSDRRRVELFEALASALEARDAYTHGHTRRVTRHATAIAQRLGLPKEQTAKVRTAAAIHDIGKLETPRDVLNKPGRLTDEEFAVIKRHPVDGARMAASLGDDDITAMVLHHHERLDGTGYPSGLAGEQIPLGARIIAVADTFDAITSRRAYRGASSHKKALAILTAEAGAQLDPMAVRAFTSHYTGSRGVALGSLLTSAPERLLPWRWSALGSAPAAKSVAALALAGALAGSAGVLAKPSPYRSAQRASLSGHVGGSASPRSHSVGATSGRQAPAPNTTAHLRAAGRGAHAPGAGHTHGKPGHAPNSGPTRPTDPGRSGGPGGGSKGPDGNGGSASGSGGGRSGGGGGAQSSTTQSSSSSGSGGQTSSSGGTSTLPVTTPSLPVTTPSLPVTTPSVPVTTPTVTVTTPSLPTTTPTVPTVTTPSLPTTQSALPGGGH
jgi:putative nucleotidyltransferase with HDIG domain